MLNDPNRRATVKTAEIAQITSLLSLFIFTVLLAMFG